MASTKVPNAWDEEDWEKLAEKPTIISRRPNPAAAPFNPPTGPRMAFDTPLLYTPSSNGQPKTLYKPDLRILKRSSPEIPTASAPTPSSSREESEKDRRERERKEKERRYKEARDRIMGDAANSSKSDSPTPDGASKSGGKKPGTPRNGKRSPDSTPNASKHKPSPARTPTRKPSPPRGSGAITSFSLNGGEFTAPPVITRHHGQQKLDGKLLESQLGDILGGDVVTEGTEEGLDWDSFSRDQGWVPQQQQQQQQCGNEHGGEYGYDYAAAPYAHGYVGYGAYPTMEKQTRAPGSSQMGVVQAVRAPRGPDADGGKGFKGRGGSRGLIDGMKGMNLGGERVREFVPGGNPWGA